MHTAGATIAGAALLAAAPAAAQQLSPKRVGSVHPGAIRFEPFAAFPAGAELAKVVADPTRPGPYVVRVKVAGGVKLLPHTHPEDRVYTVISGVFYIGFGSVFDASKLEACGPGSVVILPGSTPLFRWAMSGEYVTQVSGAGPFGHQLCGRGKRPPHWMLDLPMNLHVARRKGGKALMPILRPFLDRVRTGGFLAHVPGKPRQRRLA